MTPHMGPHALNTVSHLPPLSETHIPAIDSTVSSNTRAHTHPQPVCLHTLDKNTLASPSRHSSS